MYLVYSKIWFQIPTIWVLGTSQVIGWEDCLQSALLCVQWDS